jgi:RNA polymerase sigma factor (sigma-70 family)
LKDIQDTISKASDSGSSLSVRHEAFAELVRRFQDMAFACAYSVLGDAYLAEDVAQDSFVVAWQKLDQLREPKAFPGWFKRIVLSQCNRLLRGKRLQLVPLDAEASSPTPDPSPQVMAEKHQLLNRVLGAIKRLPDNERLVTTLFYVNGYTQADIGNFLEVPVSTVNKRLYTARQQLKESVTLLKDDLQNQRPSRNHAFVNRVTARLRPVVSQDWLAIKSMAHAREQSDTDGNDLWMHRRQNFNEDRYVGRRYVAEDATGQILGFGSIEQTIYLPRYRLFIVCDPRWLKLGVGDLLLNRLLSDLKEAGAVTVSCREYASQVELLDFLKARGFSEVDRVLDLRLELTQQLDQASFLKVVESVKQGGITITTLSERRERDPLCVQKLYELSASLHQDDPARAPFAPPAYNAREARLWLDMPYVLPDAYFIAVHGDQYVGVGGVSLFEALPDGLTQSFTGVRRDYRRRGIGTALMLRAIEYAAQHNYRIIQSFIRSIQSSVLALNEKLGFKVLSDNVTLEKCLRAVVDVDSEVYDEYAGRYLDQRRPDLEISVRNEGGRLTMEAVGQKVELFPTSKTQFFVKQFYGEATFVRNQSGLVDLVEIVMPEYQSRKRNVQHARRIN